MTITNYKVMNHAEAAEHEPAEKTFLMRIFNGALGSNGQFAPLTIRTNHLYVCTYNFDDSEPGQNGVIFDRSEAKRMIRDFISADPYCTLLAVACFKGQSRSPGVVWGLMREVFNRIPENQIGTFQGNYPNYNVHVSSTIRETGAEMQVGRFAIPGTKHI